MQIALAIIGVFKGLIEFLSGLVEFVLFTNTAPVHCSLLIDTKHLVNIWQISGKFVDKSSCCLDNSDPRIVAGSNTMLTVTE